MHPTFFIDRALFRNEDLFYLEGDNFTQDYEFLVRLSNNAKIGNVREIVLDYRVHSNQTSANVEARMQSALSISHRYWLSHGIKISEEDLKRYYGLKYL